MRAAAHSELRRIPHGDVGGGGGAAAWDGGAPRPVVRRRVFTRLRAARRGGVRRRTPVARLSGMARTRRRRAADFVRDLSVGGAPAGVPDARVARPAGAQNPRLFWLRRRGVYVRRRGGPVHPADSWRHFYAC